MADEQMPSYLRPVLAHLKGWLKAELEMRGIGTRFLDGASVRGDIPVASVPAHATTHANAGADEISVAGLSGTLADAQTPAAHKASHENAGSDEISVAGLSGLLADKQVPLVTLGSAPLVAGTATVTTAAVTANSIILLTPQTLGTIARPVGVGVTARTPSTSFVITSMDATDTSIIGWLIIEP